MRLPADGGPISEVPPKNLATSHSRGSSAPVTTAMNGMSPSADVFGSLVRSEASPPSGFLIGLSAQVVSGPGIVISRRQRPDWKTTLTFVVPLTASLKVPSVALVVKLRLGERSDEHESHVTPEGNA